MVEKCYNDVYLMFYIGTPEGQEWYGRHLDAPLYNTIDEELAWLARASQEGDLIADVGAHHGYFTMLFAVWVGQRGSVVAFECLMENACIAERNVRLNHLDNVQIIQKAVGARAGTVEIAKNSGGIRIDRTAQTAVVSVGSVSLDEFFSRRRPDLLKIDVEGWELEVLKGGKTCLAHRPKVALEFHCFKYENREAEARAILDLLPKDEYKFLWAAEPGYQLDPFPMRADSAVFIAKQNNPHLYGMPLERVT